MSRVAVLGGCGQLGSDLVRLLADRAVPLGHAEADLTDPVALGQRLNAVQPTLAINCAAYNLVDRAEEEPRAALAVNDVGVRNLATWCRDHAIPLVHVSTDYVFGADRERRTPYGETDSPGPLSVYGRSKLAGEAAVRSLCPAHWIVRTCGLYGHQSARGKGNFVETMLRLASERPELRIVNDQRCTPTSTADLAAAIIELMRTAPCGTYHATNTGDCTWYEFAQEIFRQSGLSPRVTPVTTDEYGAKARRPAYSVLDGRKLAAVGIPLRAWPAALADYLRDRTLRPPASP